MGTTLGRELSQLAAPPKNRLLRIEDNPRSAFGVRGHVRAFKAGDMSAHCQISRRHFFWTNFLAGRKVKTMKPDRLQIRAVH